MANFHRIPNAKIITMKWVSSQHAQGSNQFESIEKAAKPQSILKFMRWACLRPSPCVCAFACLLIYYANFRYLFSPLKALGTISSADIFYLATKKLQRKEQQENGMKTLQYGNSVSSSFTFEGSLLASFLPPAAYLGLSARTCSCRLDVLSCPLQFSSVWSCSWP